MDSTEQLALPILHEDIAILLMLMAIVVLFFIPVAAAVEQRRRAAQHLDPAQQQRLTDDCFLGCLQADIRCGISTFP
ncbi:hypothetical protein DF286_14310 [Sphingosinicella humi]|uniref:Uncharacterized protein n=1 Tax=Allosphingosinicella humi TaxID=2068657 RepID=A0A2U2IYZ7_9SPHN|nr:hypothetical protein DF286_14310 [Sphingosinicella humi]